MKRFILVGLVALLAGAGSAEAKDVKIGLLWDARESALNQAWEDFMKAEAKTQGEAAGINVEWVVNMANNDSSRQAANIEDLLNSGVDIVIARALDAANAEQLTTPRRSAPRSGGPRKRAYRSSPSTVPRAGRSRRPMSVAIPPIRQRCSARSS